MRGRTGLAPYLAAELVDVAVVMGLNQRLGPGLLVVLEPQATELVDDLGVAESEAQGLFDAVQVGGIDGGRSSLGGFGEFVEDLEEAGFVFLGE